MIRTALWGLLVGLLALSVFRVTLVEPMRSAEGRRVLFLPALVDQSNDVLRR